MNEAKKYHNELMAIGRVERECDEILDALEVVVDSIVSVDIRNKYLAYRSQLSNLDGVLMTLINCEYKSEQSHNFQTEVIGSKEYISAIGGAIGALKEMILKFKSEVEATNDA